MDSAIIFHSTMTDNFFAIVGDYERLLSERENAVESFFDFDGDFDGYLTAHNFLFLSEGNEEFTENDISKYNIIASYTARF